MKRSLFVFFVVMLACAFVLAQETTPPAGTGSAQQPVPPSPQNPSPQATQPSPGAAPAQPSSAPSTAPGKTKIAPGSVIAAQLAKTLDAKKVKKGDEVVAKVPQDLSSSAGQVLIPKDTKVVGHVTEVQPRSKEQKESQLAISFDRLEMKNGEQVQVPMSIQAVIAPPSQNANAANNSGGGNEPRPGSSSGGNSSGAGGRGGTAGSAPSQPSAQDNAGNTPSEPQNGAAARPQITGETKGVVGISNLTLSAAPDPTQGSLMTSEKNNVKLEDGTFLLLRVSPGGAQAAQPQSSPMPQK